MPPSPRFLLGAAISWSVCAKRRPALARSEFFLPVIRHARHAELAVRLHRQVSRSLAGSRQQVASSSDRGVARERLDLSQKVLITLNVSHVCKTLCDVRDTKMSLLLLTYCYKRLNTVWVPKICSYDAHAHGEHNDAQ